MTHIAVGADDFSPFVITWFADDLFVIARPIEYTWEETLIHDRLHTFLAERLGWEHSPALMRIAVEQKALREGHPVDRSTIASDELVAYEEAAVLHIQQMLMDRAMRKI